MPLPHDYDGDEYLDEFDNVRAFLRSLENYIGGKARKLGHLRERIGLPACIESPGADYDPRYIDNLRGKSNSGTCMRPLHVR